MMNTTIRNSTLLLVAAMLLCGTTFAQSDSSDSTQSTAQAVAEKLANPNAAIGFFAIPIDYIHYSGDLPGASSQNAFKMSFQPSLPYPIKPGHNIFLRPLIPFVIKQPTIAPDGAFVDQSVELGDIGFDFAYGITHPSGLATIFGVAGSAPTATQDGLGTGRWMLGPEAFIGKKTKWGFLGLLVTHTWSLNDNVNNDVATNDQIFSIHNTYFSEDNVESNNTLMVTSGQYMYTVNLKNAWQIQAQPTWSINWSADSGNRVTIPIATGVAKTIMFGKMPLKFALFYWYYFETPDIFGPQHQIRLQIAPVIKLPWGKK